MERMTVAEAANELNMSVIAVRYLMQKERLPIGYAMKQEDHENFYYIIYRELVEGFKKRVEQGILNDGKDGGVCDGAEYK
jgi:hypothetical protein